MLPKLHTSGRWGAKCKLLSSQLASTCSHKTARQHVHTTPGLSIQKEPDRLSKGGLWNYHSLANREARFRRRDGLPQVAEKPDLVLCYEMDHATTCSVIFRSVYAVLPFLPVYSYFNFSQEGFQKHLAEWDKAMAFEKFIFWAVGVPSFAVAFVTIPLVLNICMARLYYDHSLDVFVGVKLNAFRPWQRSVFEIQPKELTLVENIPAPANMLFNGIVFKSKVTGEYVIMDISSCKSKLYSGKLVQM